MSLRQPHQAQQSHRSDLSSPQALDAVLSQQPTSSTTATAITTATTITTGTTATSSCYQSNQGSSANDSTVCGNQDSSAQDQIPNTTRSWDQNIHSFEQQEQHQQQQDEATSSRRGNESAESEGEPSASPWARFRAQGQDHLRLFFAMHHKLFDLVAFYVVMFAINGQMTSLPTRLEWIGFCVQSIVALRRAFQTSIKHGLGLTSFLGMLDLLVGQLFLHQDRLGLLPTVANILVYFYVINLTRGLVFGDSVSCLLWFLFGLVDIYRRDPSSASIIDLTPYRVIPVHTVGFGLYILMSELVDVMLQSAESDQTQGRYLNYVGAQKQNPVAIRTSRRSRVPSSSDVSNNLRFELCITEITPYTVSFCLNALSDAPTQSPPSPSETGNQNQSKEDSTAKTADNVDVSSIKIASAAGLSSASSGSGSKAKSSATPKIISTSDIVIHVNYIPWQEVQYHFPDEQSFTLYGLTPSTDYEIEMKVHQFSSFVTRVGTRAASLGSSNVPTLLEKASRLPESAAKSQRNRKSKKNQKHQKNGTEKDGSGGGAAGKAKKSFGGTSESGSVVSNDSHTSSHTPPQVDSTEAVRSSLDARPNTLQMSAEQILIKELKASIEASVDAANTTRATIKKLKRDQIKAEALMKQELEGIGRAQAKAIIQDQKRRQKLSFLQESIKQTDAQAESLQDEIHEIRSSVSSSGPQMDELTATIRTLESQIVTSASNHHTELSPLKAEAERLDAKTKSLESDRLIWLAKTVQVQENEIAPLQLRLQRLEQQQIVWQVAAEANKEKDREATVRITMLEKESQLKMTASQALEQSIQEMKDANAIISASVEKELIAWDSLEHETEMVQTYRPTTAAIPHQLMSSSPPLPFKARELGLESAPTTKDTTSSRQWFSSSSGTGYLGSGLDVWRTHPEASPRPNFEVLDGNSSSVSLQDSPKSGSGRSGASLAMSEAEQQ
ncbi:hypothetical protein BGZ83_010580 [Gryganskiella cystojenkinii]|nr:hypothetical protein BGZ83_010580 [Gryganskiella cystojenkinii]